MVRRLYVQVESHLPDNTLTLLSGMDVFLGTASSVTVTVGTVAQKLGLRHTALEGWLGDSASPNVQSQLVRSSVMQSVFDMMGSAIGDQAFQIDGTHGYIIHSQREVPIHDQ